MKRLKPKDFLEIAEHAIAAQKRCGTPPAHVATMGLALTSNALDVAFSRDTVVFAVGRLIARTCAIWKILQLGADDRGSFDGVHVAIHSALFPNCDSGLFSSAQTPPKKLLLRLNRIALAAGVEHPKDEAMKAIEHDTRQFLAAIGQCK